VLLLESSIYFRVRPETSGGVMALINCYECGENVSDTAVACPDCGAPPGKASNAQMSQASSDLSPDTGSTPLQPQDPDEPTELAATKHSGLGWLQWVVYLFVLFVVFKLFGVLLSIVLLVAVATWDRIGKGRTALRAFATIGVLLAGLLLWAGIHWWSHDGDGPRAPVRIETPPQENNADSWTEYQEQQISPPSPTVDTRQIQEPSPPTPQAAPVAAQPQPTSYPNTAHNQRCWEQYNQATASISDGVPLGEYVQRRDRFKKKLDGCLHR
jgi:hypothetical protein